MRRALSTTPPFRPAMRTASFLPTECLAFSLAGRAYAVDMQQVQELRGYGALAALNQPAAQRQRWLDLRGARVPHLDLHSALGLTALEHARSAVVVAALESRVVCFIVDGILGVRRSDKTHVPRCGDAYSSEVRTTQDETLWLLDLDRILEADALLACPTVLDDNGSPAWTDAD